MAKYAKSKSVRSPALFPGIRNGNGDVSEGISAEIGGLQSMLMKAIQAYGKEVAGAPIAYDPASYPYFFNDANDNGTVDGEEATAENAAYASWTAENPTWKDCGLAWRSRTTQTLERLQEMAGITVDYS